MHQRSILSLLESGTSLNLAVILCTLANKAELPGAPRQLTLSLLPAMIRVKRRCALKTLQRAGGLLEAANSAEQPLAPVTGQRSRLRLSRTTTLKRFR